MLYRPPNPLSRSDWMKRAEPAYKEIRRKRSSTRYLLLSPVLLPR